MKLPPSGARLGLALSWSGVALLLAACGGGGSSAPDPDALATWTDFGAVALDATGSSTELRVPWRLGQAGLLLEVGTASGACFQIDALGDDSGHLYTGSAEGGAYCVACEQRTAVAAGRGWFALPSRGGAFKPVGALTLRLGLRDCDTLTHAGPTLGASTLSVRARGLRAATARGTLPLRLIVTPASVFHDPTSDAALAALLAALNAELASAQLSATWSAVTRLPAGSVSDAAFSRADSSALQTLRSQADPAPSAGAIPVVLAGCLQLREPVLGRTSEPEGYTPHIPGGAGPADGIFIGGSLCATPGPVRIAWSASALARVLAHELGHYLGLFHSVEADGTTDQLEDTGAANLMFYRPGAATATGLSSLQGGVMRAHPAVLPAN